MTKANGELISIDDSAYDGFKGMTVYGNTRQNLWVNPPTTTVKGVTATANSDGSVTLSGTPTAMTNIHSEKVYSLRPGSTYYLSCSPNPAFMVGISQYINGSFKSTKAMPKGGGVVTIDSDVTEFTCVLYGFDIVTTVSGTYRVMLNEGSEAQPWCPPGLNSVDELSVVTAGKNMLDGTGYYISSYTYGYAIGYRDQDRRTPASFPYTTKRPYYGVQAFFYAVAGETYTFSQVNAPDGAILKYQQFWDGQDIVAANASGYTGCAASTLIKGPVTFRRSGLVVVLSCINSNAVGVTWPEGFGIQLELGSTATAYEPPNITTTPINLQGHTLNALPDGTRDELPIDATGAVTLTKRTQTVQLDGDRTWLAHGSPFKYYASAWSNYGGLPSGYSSDRHFVDKLIASSNVANGLYSADINGARAYLREPTFASDAAGVKEWMGANTPTVIMPLLEPQTIQLGKISLPKLRKRPLVNKVWANGTAGGTGFSLAPEIDYEYNQWSTYCDGFKTHGKHSYFDMGCCIAARDTGTPEKKSVTATVPYMSGFYDLSKLYGAIAFEARQLMYRFEFVEDSRDELQQKKSQFLEWLSQVHNEEIADDDIPGRHFIGSLSEWEFEEGEEGQSGSLEVTFNCQPFLEADEDTTKTCNAGSNTVTVNGQAVNAYAKTSSGTATIRIGGVTQSVGTTEIRLSVQLQPGDNAVTVTGSPVTLRWRELTV